MNEKSGVNQQEHDSSGASVLRTVWNFFKPVAKVGTIFQMIQTADAVCISINGAKLYRFNCYNQDDFSTILTSIETICPNPQTGWEFCPDPYSNDYIMEGFGSGYFGGTVCYLTHKIGETSGCVIDIVKSNVTNGLFGSDVDVLATMGICFGGVIAISGMVFGGIFLIPYLRDRAKANAVAAANERSRLINDDRGSTAPNELSIIVPK